jgi:hypothetical protein
MNASLWQMKWIILILAVMPFTCQPCCETWQFLIRPLGIGLDRQSDCQFMLQGIIQNWIIAKFQRALASGRTLNWWSLVQRFDSSRNWKTAEKRFFRLCGNKITIPDKDYLIFPILSIFACKDHSKLDYCKVSKGVGQWKSIQPVILNQRFESRQN